MRRCTLFLMMICITLCMIPSACHDGATKPFVIGVIDVGTHQESLFNGFKAGMTDFGYIEGKDVVYRHNTDLPNTQEAIESEIKELLDDGVDMLYTISTNSTMRAKKMTEDTNVPVIFGLVTDPVLNGFVDTIARPGGNLTGVSSYSIDKSVKWIVQIAPDTKYVYMPIYRDEQEIEPFKGLLEEAAKNLEIEISSSEVQDLEEIIAALKNLPENSAVIFSTRPWAEERLPDFLEIAVKRKIPVGTFLPSLIDKKGILTTISSDLFAIGKQAARLTDQVINGAEPRDLPVESAESFFAINLKTAEAIDLQIPNLILLQADKIVR